MPTYVMRTRGTTEGGQTGQKHYYKPGTRIQAPEGEFDHLPPSSYEARVVDTTGSAQQATPTASTGRAEDAGDGPRYVVGETAPNGWTPVVDTQTGETEVNKRSREAAQEAADDLNANA